MSLLLTSMIYFRLNIYFQDQGMYHHALFIDTSFRMEFLEGTKFGEVKWLKFILIFSMMEHYCSSEVYYDDQIFFKNPSAWYMDSLLR